MKKRVRRILTIAVSLTLGLAVGYFIAKPEQPEVTKTIVEQGQISGYTLAQIQNRDKLRCGVNGTLPGFSLNLADKDDENPDNKFWQGFNIDFCRALAAAIFADSDKVKFLHLDNRDRFTALQAGRVDVLAHNSSYTIGRDGGLHLNFAGVLYYDGQGFLVPRSLEIDHVDALQEVIACVVTGTITARNFIYYMNQQNIAYRLIVLDTVDDAFQAYNNGRCNIYSADRSLLAGQRLLLREPDEHLLLPDVISKEPLGPVLREGDDNWADIVRWVVYALIAAEELGVNSSNVSEMLASENPAVRRLLGRAGEFGAGLGLPNDWAFQIISQVGNYAEIYERNLGIDTPIALNRDINALWQDGGILYSLPIR